MNNPAAATITAAADQSTAVLRISSAALAMISPAVTGCSPACSAFRQGASLNRYHTPLTSNVRIEDGAAIAAVVTSAPQNPATRQPTRLTTIRFGPGAACASAYSAANSPRVHPVMHVDHLALHLRDHRGGAAERQQRKLRMHHRQVQQRAHDRNRHSSAVEPSASTGSAAGNGRRSTAIARNVHTATPIASGRPRNGEAIFQAVDEHERRRRGRQRHEGVADRRQIRVAVVDHAQPDNDRHRRGHQPEERRHRSRHTAKPRSQRDR